MKYRITVVVDADTPAAMHEMDWALMRNKAEEPVPLLCLRSVYDAARMSYQTIQIEIEREDKAGNEESMKVTDVHGDS